MVKKTNDDSNCVRGRCCSPSTKTDAPLKTNCLAGPAIEIVVGRCSILSRKRSITVPSTQKKHKVQNYCSRRWDQDPLKQLRNRKRR